MQRERRAKLRTTHWPPWYLRAGRDPRVPVLLQSLGAFEIAGRMWRPSATAHSMTIVAKGTFDLVPGQMRLAPRQDPIATSESFRPDGSIYQPGDLAPHKSRCEVV